MNIPASNVSLRVDTRSAPRFGAVSRYENLLAWARECFAVRSVEYRWSAHNGITFGTVAARPAGGGEDGIRHA